VRAAEPVCLSPGSPPVNVTQDSTAPDVRTICAAQVLVRTLESVYHSLEASAVTVCKATAVTDVRLIPAVGVDLVHVLLTRSVIPPVLVLSASQVVTVR